VLLRRLPVEDYSKDDLGLIFWGIGTHLGRGLSQSVMGDRLGHVKDFSREDPRARAYRNKQELSPHPDSCDLVGLLCLRNAQAGGGVSRLTSAISVHNALLAEHPDALAALYRGYVRHRRGEEQPGELAYTPYRIPVYSNIEGKVSARYVRSYLEAGEAAAGRPMGPAELAVIDTFEAVTKRPELCSNSRCSRAKHISSTTTRSCMRAPLSTTATRRRTCAVIYCGCGSTRQSGPCILTSIAAASCR
jgi:hypothetical protein